MKQKEQMEPQSSEQELSQQALLEKYDPEHTVRRNLGKWAWIVTIVGIALTMFHLYTGFRGSYVSLIQGSIHLGAGLALIFILYPIKKTGAKKVGVPWYDGLFALIALGCNYYIFFNYERIVTDAIVFGFTPLDKVVATVAVILLLEATRRAVGIPIVIIAITAIGYAIWGRYIPLFGHQGFSWGELSTELFYGTNAIFGIPLQISSTYIYLFLFFGVLLVKTGIGEFFNDLAFALTGKFTGGTAKAAVVSSGLQGMVSGSSVANTVGSGAFTIPMMKKNGFKPSFSAAVEASSSTGGQIMPPIMGAAAFIMAEYTGVPYNEIIIIAAIPAILYFSGVFFGAHFEAKKQGITGVSKDKLPSFKSLMKRLDLLIPLIIIIGFLVSGFTATYSALFGIISAFLFSMIRKETRMSFREIIRTLEDGARTALPVIAACATAGVIVGVVTLTGLGGMIAGGIIDLSQGNFFLLLFLTMIACLILGMGLPTTANYVVTASMAAPAILGLFPDIPVIAVHLFVFYFGIVADITPPVCLAAYAGAGIAGANPMKTGVTSTKLAIAAFIIPYMFVSNPVLVLQGDPTISSVIVAIVTALLGMAGISAGLMGFFIAEAKWWERVLLIGSGLLLIYPNIIDSLIGFVVLGGLALFQFVRSRAKKHQRKIAL
ncbi:MAG TPA: TRAP transporter permease [Bacillales bacterium]